MMSAHILLNAIKTLTYFQLTKAKLYYQRATHKHSQPIRRYVDICVYFVYLCNWKHSTLCGIPPHKTDDRPTDCTTT